MRAPVPSGSAPGAARYQEVFVDRVHQLLARGYELMRAACAETELQQKDEPKITGLLVKAMNKARHDDQIRDWAWLFCVKDDPRVDDHGLEGNDRPRIDIQVQELRQAPPEPCFQFEAKRLYDDGTLDKYMGTPGLQSLLNGWYAREHDDAGMLAYVQAELLETWAARVHSRLGQRRKLYGLCSAGPYWTKRGGLVGLVSYTSFHPEAPERTARAHPEAHEHRNRPLRVHQTFLLCC